ncbi:OB-fold protein [Chitinophaga sp. RAB17]|uniref:OB-fold protein n=1 Tax=Chitinophaga sp. RAB17 TaxID=3233049 RepID=UPI003F923645
MMTKITSNNYHRSSRLITVAVGLLLLLVAGVMAWYFFHQPDTVSLNDSTNIVLDVSPEDTSIGKCLQYPIGVMTLQKLYLSNDPEANEKYTNKTVYITGTYIGTGWDPMGTAYMLLRSNDRFHAIKCFLSNNKEVYIMKGSSLLVKGYCRGLIWDLKIEDCELLDIPVTTAKII